jgi:Fic family protein
MAFIETVKRNGKIYYYAVKNFRIKGGRWRKMRRYLGTRRPTRKEAGKAFEEIDREAKERGYPLKTRFKYLDEGDAERIEDVRHAFSAWCGKMDPVEREKYDSDFLVRFTYNTNAIEGNRLSLRQTAVLLNEGFIPSGTDHDDVMEALNSRDAFELARTYKRGLNRTFILRLHKELMKNTRCRKIGELRDSRVRIAGSDWVPPDPAEVPEEMKGLFIWFNNNKKRLHPVELGAIVHLRLVQIHPFVDGNGRTARLVMNWVLFRNGYPMFYIENRRKSEYYDAIEAGDKEDRKAFIRYVATEIIRHFTYLRE